jgi:hypothetical protein
MGQPATPGRCLHKSHVNAIDIRPFFAVDFDVHELTVHDFGRPWILEGFVRHDMAPMTGRITDRKKDRFVFLTRFRKRLFAPWKPLNRVFPRVEASREIFRDLTG